MATKKTDFKKPSPKNTKPALKKIPATAKAGKSCRKTAKDKACIRDLKKEITLLKRYASFPELNPSPVLEISLAGEILFSNKAAAQTLRELKLEDNLAVYLPHDVDEMLKALKQGKKKEYRCIVNIKDRIFGEVIYLVPEFDTLRVYAHDITERKREEERLNKESREIEMANRILAVFIKESGDDLYDNVLNIILKETASRHGVFGYIAEPGHLICPSLSKMLDECEIEGKCIHYPPDKWKGLWARALKEKRSLYTNEPSPVPRGHPVIRNNLAVPILFQGEAIGLLNLANKKGGYSEADRETLDGIAGRIAPVLYAQIQKELRATESRRTVEALRENEERFRRERDFISAVLSTSGALVTVLDLQGKIVSFNRTCEQISGYTFEEVKGRRFWDFLLVPEEIEPVKAVFRDLKAGQFPNNFENYWVSRDGIRHLISWTNTTLLDGKGNAEYIVGTGIDITARKRAELDLERMRNILAEGQRLAHVGSWEYLPTTRETNWSDEEFRIYGLEPSGKSPSYAELIQRHIHPDDVAELERTFRLALQTGKVFELEHRIVRPDGSVRVTHNLARPCFDEQGQLVKYIGATLDITERKQRIDLSEGLNRINEIISSTLDPDEIMRRVVGEACKVMGSESAGIALRDDGHWVSKYVYRFPPEVEGVRFTDQVLPEVALAAKIKKPLVINDTFNDERVNRQKMERFGVRSVLALPLILYLEEEEEEVFGVMGFNFHSAPSTFTDAQIDFATKLGASVSLALEKARLFVKEKEAIRLSNALNFINTLVTSSLDVDKIMRGVVGEATKAIGSETTGISFREKGYWIVKYVHGLSLEVLGLRLTDEDNPHGFLAISKRKVISINDAFSDLRVNREVMEKFDIRAVMVVPLYSKEKPIGAIFFNYHTSPVKFTDAQIDFAHKLGISISLALENARLFQEIKEAEQSLRKSEEDLSRAQEVGKIGSWRLDVQQNVLTWSDENHRIFGIPRGTQMTYETFLSIVHPDDREYVDRKWKEGLSGENYDIEHRILVNGNTKWVREKAYLEFDDSGQLLGGFGITQDITEKKMAENELCESEERLNMALYAGHVFGFEWNPLTDTVVRSKNCGIILGLRGEEAIYDTGRAFFHRIHPEDRESFIARIDSLTPEKNTYSVKYRLVRPDGEHIVLEETAIGQFDSRGQLIKLYGMTADVTERTKSEEALLESRARLSILSETAGQLLASDNPLQIIYDLCRKVMNFLDCHVFFNYLIDDEKKQLHLNAYAGIPAETAKGIEWLNIGAAVCGCVARDGKRIVAQNIPESDDPRTDLVRSFGIKSYACHPLIAQGKVIGTLSFGTRSKPGFSDDEVDLMNNIADQVSIAMQRVMNHQKLQKYSEELEKEVQERTKEIREKVQIIDLERERLYSVLEKIPAYVCLLTADYKFAYSNQEFKRRFGDPEKRYCYEFLFGRQKPCENCTTYRVFSEQKDQQWEWTGPDGKTYAIFDYLFIDTDGSRLILEMGMDVTEFKKAVKNLSGTNTLLDLFTRTTSRKEYIASVVPVLQQWSSFRCVGIRIADDEENIPYEAYTGFSDEFYKLENKLSLKKDMCACIRTVTGRFEPQDSPVLTAYGSICINKSQIFAESLTKEELARYRGNCIRSGFQSIVLVPIRYRGHTVGLIHLADEREGMAPFPVIQFLEAVANLIGEAIHRFNTEEALRKSKTSLSEAQRMAHMGSWEWEISSGRLSWSDEVYRIFGFSHQEFMPSYDAFLSFVHPDDRESLEEAIKEALYQQTPYAIDHRIVLPDGSEKIVHEQGEIVFDEKGFPLRMMGTVQDITKIKHIEHELRLSEERLRELYAHLHSVRESERAYIAREIHDEFGTILTALNIDLSWLEKKIPKDQQTLMERVSKDVELVNSAIKMVQRISSELRPAVLDYLGLPSAVEWQVKEFGNRTGIEWNIDIDMKTADLDKDLTIAFFRILQESLTNIARYAEATKINVALHENDGFLTLEVTDNGKGVSEEQLSDPNSLGIFGMRERVQYFGGVIDITGIPHKGTTVAVKVPVVKQGA